MCAVSVTLGYVTVYLTATDRFSAIIYFSRPAAYIACVSVCVSTQRHLTVLYFLVEANAFIFIITVRFVLTLRSLYASVHRLQVLQLLCLSATSLL